MISRVLLFLGLELKSAGFCFRKYENISIFLERDFLKNLGLRPESIGFHFRKYKNFFNIRARKFHFQKYK